MGNVSLTSTALSYMRGTECRGNLGNVSLLASWRGKLISVSFRAKRGIPAFIARGISGDCFVAKLLAMTASDCFVAKRRGDLGNVSLRASWRGNLISVSFRAKRGNPRFYCERHKRILLRRKAPRNDRVIATLVFKLMPNQKNAGTHTVCVPRFALMFKLMPCREY